MPRFEKIGRQSYNARNARIFIYTTNYNRFLIDRRAANIRVIIGFRS
jgi:hypothetical protein